MAAEPNPYLYKLERALTRAEVLDELAAMPGRLRGLVAAASPDELLRAPGGDSWSAFQTLCHVRDATLTYAARFRWIVFDDDPLMPDYDENNWVASAKDTPADVPGMLALIEASRDDLIKVLRRMPEEAWQRTGRHAVAGSIVLEHYARHQVVHEEAHLAQIRAALAQS